MFNDFKELKCKDFNCDQSLFSNESNHVIKSTSKNFTFKMITFGSSTVAVVDESLFGDFSQFFSEESGIFCFDAPQLIQIDKILNKNNYTLGEITETFLPHKTEELPHIDLEKFNIKKISKNEIKDLENIEEYENALNPIESKIGNELAYAALYNDEIVSIAGTSANYKKFWSIGVDTKEQYRKNGLGAYLTNCLTRDIIELALYPYYTTWYSNIGSRKIALQCGFRPYCVEVDSQKIMK